MPCKAYISKILKGHTAEQKNLATDMKFSYQQAIGELLFAAITCRPDILYLVIN